MDWAMVAADSFGNALGNSIVADMKDQKEIRVANNTRKAMEAEALSMPPQKDFYSRMLPVSANNPIDRYRDKELSRLDAWDRQEQDREWMDETQGMMSLGRSESDALNLEADLTRLEEDYRAAKAQSATQAAKRNDDWNNMIAFAQGHSSSAMEPVAVANPRQNLSTTDLIRDSTLAQRRNEMTHVPRAESETLKNIDAYFSKVVRGQFAIEALDRYDRLLEGTIAGDPVASKALVGEVLGFFGGGVGRFVKGVANSEAAAYSRLSQPGGLAATEGGQVLRLDGRLSNATHPLGNHGPDVSNEFIYDRVANELSSNSRTGLRTAFNDRAQMEAAINDTFAARQQDISAWLSSNPRAGVPRAFEANPRMGNLGRGYEITTKSGPIVPITRPMPNVNLVLISDGKGGFLIHTAHPF